MKFSKGWMKDLMKKLLKEEEEKSILYIGNKKIGEIKKFEISHNILECHDAFSSSFKDKPIIGKKTISFNLESKEFEMNADFLKEWNKIKHDFIYKDKLRLEGSLNTKVFGLDFEAAGYVFNCGEI